MINHPRVLIAQDDDDLRIIWRTALAAQPWTVEFASNGVEALRMWNAAANVAESYDAVLTDVGMPRMDGVDLARAIREMSPNTPIAFASAYDGATRIAQAVRDLNVLEVRGRLPGVLESSDIVHALRTMLSPPESSADGVLPAPSGGVYQ